MDWYTQSLQIQLKDTTFISRKKRYKHWSIRAISEGSSNVSVGSSLVKLVSNLQSINKYGLLAVTLWNLWRSLSPDMSGWYGGVTRRSSSYEFLIAFSTLLCGMLTSSQSIEFLKKLNIFISLKPSSMLGLQPSRSSGSWFHFFRWIFNMRHATVQNRF